MIKFNYLRGGTNNNPHKFAFIVTVNGLIDHIVELDNRCKHFNNTKKIVKKEMRKEYSIKSKCTQYKGPKL
jgi:hypothetical protein